VADTLRPWPRAEAALLGLLLLASYAYFLPAPAWNESSRFDLVRSLVERQRIDIDPYHLNTEDKAFRDGHFYSDKAPGAAFLAVPAYAAYYSWLRVRDAPLPQAVPESVLRGGKAVQQLAPGERIFLNTSFRRAVYLCNLSTNALAGAALGVLFFLVLVRRAVPPRLALAATAALALGTPVFAYSTMFYGHVLAAAFLFAAFALLGPLFPTADATPPRRLAIAGLLLGMAILCELPAGLGAAAIGIFGLIRLPRDNRLRGLLWLSAGAAPALLALAVYQLAAFGSPLATGYNHLHNPDFAQGMGRGLLGVSWPRPAALFGMLLGGSRGLLYISPVLALAFLGLVVALVRRIDRPLWTAAVAVVAAFFLMSAGYYMWWGGAALGPRHVVPALPFLALGLPAAVLAGKSGGARRAVLILLLLLLVVSVVNQTAAVAVSALVPSAGDVLREHVYPPLLRGKVAVLGGSANAGLLLGLRGPASLLPLLALWLLGFRAVWSGLPPESIHDSAGEPR
jgi:hypothetical protein